MDRGLWLSDRVSPHRMLTWLSRVDERGNYFSKGHTRRHNKLPGVLAVKESTLSVLTSLYDWLAHSTGPGVVPARKDYWGKDHVGHWTRLVHRTLEDCGIPHQKITYCIRCLFGYPWSIPYCRCSEFPIPCEWCIERGVLLRWHGGVVKNMLETAVQNWSSYVPEVLADALEEAGFSNIDILMHLRGYQRCSVCLGLGTERRGVSYLENKEHKNRIEVIPCRASVDGYDRNMKTDYVTRSRNKYAKNSPYIGLCTNGWCKVKIDHARGCHVIGLLLGRLLQDG